jgi:hypothetical protein
MIRLVVQKFNEYLRTKLIPSSVQKAKPFSISVDV